MSRISRLTAMRPISASGWRTVVRAGVTEIAPIRRWPSSALLRLADPVGALLREHLTDLVVDGHVNDACPVEAYLDLGAPEFDGLMTPLTPPAGRVSVAEHPVSFVRMTVVCSDSPPSGTIAAAAT
jgi:hypothetical protein